jgi:hypothetical protein
MTRSRMGRQRRPVIFLGPTLSAVEARQVFPNADYRPPVAQGDLLSMVGRETPEAIGIIDGVFFQDLPVWHKEILLAIERGIEVYGASSMGALRAAECHPFGMVGVGSIFEAYVAGELMGDDEVALAHEGLETNWRPRTEPMVNLRFTMRHAVQRGEVGAAVADRFLRAAKDIWFAERTRQALVDRARSAGIDEPSVLAIMATLKDSYVDQKRLDAVELLGVLRSRMTSCEPAAPTPRGHGVAAPGDRAVAVRSHFLEAFVERDRQVTHGDVPLRVEEIARFAALHHPRFAVMRDRALDRLAAESLAITWSVSVSEEEVAAEARRIRARLQLTDQSDVEAWLEANDVDEEWLAELAAREARLRRLRDSIQIRQGLRALVQPLLDELRLAGDYEEWARRAAAYARTRDSTVSEASESGAGVPGPLEERGDELMRSQIQAGGWRPDVPLARFAEEAGFQDLADLFEELRVARQVRLRARQNLALLDQVLAADPCLADHDGVLKEF